MLVSWLVIRAMQTHDTVPAISRVGVDKKKFFLEKQFTNNILSQLQSSSGLDQPGRQSDRQKDITKMMSIFCPNCSYM